MSERRIIIKKKKIKNYLYLKISKRRWIKIKAKYGE